MNNWDLPKIVFAGGREWRITNECDYRVVFDVFAALKDEEFSQSQRVANAIFVFYEDFETLDDVYNASEYTQGLYEEMVLVCNQGKKTEQNAVGTRKPAIMDWEHDWHMIAPAVSRVLGYDVREKNKYTHWYTLAGAYMEIGDCYFAQVISYRNKRIKGKKLEKTDREFYKDHKEDIDLPVALSSSERAWLDGEW